MSPLDATFLHLERDVQQLHVGSALLFEGPAPRYDDVCAAIVGRLRLVPRYRQRVVSLPLHLGQPVWVDDPHFAIGYHLRHTALPSPGGEEQLRALAGRIMSQHLDLARPLWEMWLVEGLAGGRWALVNKAHHAMIDGLSGTDIMGVMLDRDAKGAPAVPDAWTPEPAPSTSWLLGNAALDLVRNPLEQAAAIVTSVRNSPGAALQQALDRASGLRHLGGTVARPESVLNGPIGPHRRWGWARADLRDAKRVKKVLGGTLNDVVLAMVTGAFREFLTARGEDVEGRTIRTMVPVSVRRPEHPAHGNQVTSMFADLPVGIDDPVERLRLISTQLDALKRNGAALGMKSLVSAADFLPPTLLAIGARLSTHVPQRAVSTVTTNVPGPQVPMYLLGRRMAEMFPYIPLANDLRVTIGVFSYAGELAFGVTGDYDEVSDLDVLCAGIEESATELAEITRRD